MINLERFLNFLSGNIYLLIIFIVLGLIAHFWGLFYIREHRNEDFSYSGHLHVWYEGSEFILFLAYIYSVDCGTVSRKLVGSDVSV